jgi:hypothetical protein
MEEPWCTCCTTERAEPNLPNPLILTEEPTATWSMTEALHPVRRNSCPPVPRLHELPTRRQFLNDKLDAPVKKSRTEALPDALM